MHKLFNKQYPTRFNFLSTLLSSSIFGIPDQKLTAIITFPNPHDVKRSIQFQDVKIWNSLSTDKKHQSFDKFKSPLKKLLSYYR